MKLADCFEEDIISWEEIKKNATMLSGVFGVALFVSVFANNKENNIDLTSFHQKTIEYSEGVQQDVSNVLHSDFSTLAPVETSTDMMRLGDLQYRIVVDNTPPSNAEPLNLGKVDQMTDGTYLVTLNVEEIKKYSNTEGIAIETFINYIILNELGGLSIDNIVGVDQILDENSDEEKRKITELLGDLAGLKGLQSILKNDMYDLDAQKMLMLSLFNKYQFSEEMKDSNYEFKTKYDFITSVVSLTVSHYDQIDKVDNVYFADGLVNLKEGDTMQSIKNSLLLSHIIDGLESKLNSIVPGASEDIDQLVNNHINNNENGTSALILASN